jgi:hypothetical protein
VFLEIIMRKSLMLSVSAIVLLAASQQAFAIDKQQAITSRPDLTVQQRIKPDVTIQQQNMQLQNRQHQKMHAPTARELPKAGGMNGPGNFGGFGGAGKQTGMGGIAPSGATGKAQDGVSGIKGSRGQRQGVGAKEGPTGKQAEGMRKSIGEAAASRGKEKGVEGQEGATAKQSAVMRKAIGEAAEGRGQEKGVEAKEGGGKLSKEQRQSMKDMTFDPKVNPQLGSKDPEGKGGGKGAGRPKGEGKGGAGGKPIGPKPTGGSAGGKGGGGKVAGVNPKTGGSKKEPAPKPKVSEGGKLIVFPAVKITPKPAKGPLDGVFKPKPPKPEPKTDASTLNVDAVTTR